MNKLPDRAKMRREYLAKRTETEIEMLIGGGMMIFCSFLGLIFTLIALYSIPIAGIFSVFPLGGAGLCVVLAIMGHYGYKSADTKLRSIPYVAPIREQLPTLPAEEVLLRGSQASPAYLEELLIPAAMSRETRAEELLRAASVGE